MEESRQVVDWAPGRGRRTGEGGARGKTSLFIDDNRLAAMIDGIERGE